MDAFVWQRCLTSLGVVVPTRLTGGEHYPTAEIPVTERRYSKGEQKCAMYARGRGACSQRLHARARVKTCQCRPPQSGRMLAKSNEAMKPPPRARERAGLERRQPLAATRIHSSNCIFARCRARMTV